MTPEDRIQAVLAAARYEGARQINGGYLFGGIVCVTAAAFNIPLVFVFFGRNDGLKQIYTRLGPIVEFGLISFVIIGSIACFYLIDDRIRRRAFDWHRASRLFFWLSFWFWFGLFVIGVGAYI